ncbi:peptide deformylase [bacterium]|nr:peptide deformylase [bacterium]MBU1990877.1 peptide deformylase [bacterium]
MIREIITYPTPPSVQYGTDVRVFDEALFVLIDDLKDTIIDKDLEGLAAFQIGGYFNVVVIKKEDGSFLELINPRLISTEGKITTTEKTAYFPGLSAEISRYDNISIVYQDREGKNMSLRANGAFAVLIQRKLDYTFGANFLSKLSKEERKKFEKKLEFGMDIAISESCPTTFKRDYFSKVANAAMIAMLLLLVSSLFISDENTLLGMWKYQVYLSFGVLILNIGYFFYGQYEGKKYSTCTSCQIGNLIGTVVISLIKLTLIMIVSYFIL